MAEIDTYIQHFFMDYVMLGIYLGILLFCVKTLYPKIKKCIVWQQLQQSERCYANVTRFQRQELLAPLHGLISADLILRNEGIIRIIDIGVMTGINVRYYPNSSHVIAVDMKHNLEYFFKPQVGMFDHLRIKQCIEYDCHTLRNVPDNYADVVVGSFILCKAKNEAILLNEIHRILAPGGHYYFIEHCIESDNSSLRRWQNLLSVSGIWPHLFYGCHLNRDIETAILKSQFSVVKCNLKKFHFLHPVTLRYIRSHVMGYAYKE